MTARPARLHVTEILTDSSRHVFYHFVADGEEYRLFRERDTSRVTAVWWEADDLVNIMKRCVDGGRCTIIEIYAECRRSAGRDYICDAFDPHGPVQYIVMIRNGRMDVDVW